MAAIRRLGSAAIRSRKHDRHQARFAVVTAYDAAFVGDSLGNVVLGYECTTPVDLEDMCCHGAAVARGNSKLYASAPPFAKRYAELAVVATDAFREYAREVREGTFPAMSSAAARPS